MKKCFGSRKGGAGGGPPPLLCINDALPQELIGLVLRKLSDLIDFGRARCVCKAWHQLASPPSTRPPSALWCLIHDARETAGRRLRSFDLFSGQEYKMEVPAATPLYLGIKGQGGLIALCSRGKYRIGNPLPNKWAQVDMTGCGGSGSIWKVGTSELVICRAQDGSSSYKLVQFMYHSDKLGHKLRVDIYDSRSRVWTAGSTLEHPYRLEAGRLNRLGLQSCVWSGRIYLLLSITTADTEFSIVEYSVEKDTLTVIVPLAYLPMSREEGNTLAWHGVFQVQVREDCEDGSSRVQLVLAKPSSTYTWSCRPIQVFAWDHTLGLWVVQVQPKIPKSSGPTSHRLCFCRPGPEDQDLTSLGFLVHGIEVLASYPPESAVAVCRTDTLAERHCKIKTTVHNSALNGHCFFPNFHDQP